MDRNGIALNTLMFIRMSSNIFYPFSTIYPVERVITPKQVKTKDHAAQILG